MRSAAQKRRRAFECLSRLFVVLILGLDISLCQWTTFKFTMGKIMKKMSAVAAYAQQKQVSCPTRLLRRKYLCFDTI